MKIDKKEAIKQVLDDYADCLSSKLYLEKKDQRKKWKDLYNSKRPDTSFPFEDCSNIDLGVVQIHTDSLKSRLKLAIIGSHPIFQMLPDTELVQSKEDAMSWLLASNLIGSTGETGVEAIIDDITYNTCVYGTCIIKDRWEVKEKIYRTMVEKNILGVSQEENNTFSDTKSEEEERVRLSVVSLEDFLIPSDALNIQEANYCIHRLYLTEIELKARKKYYQNIDKVTDWFEKAKKATNDKDTDTYSRKRLEIIEWYGMFEVDGKIQECIFTVAKEPGILLRASLLIDVYWDNQRPFTQFILEKTENFYGKGIPEKLEVNAEALNDIYNISMNMAYYQMMGCGFIDENAQLSEKYEISPGVFNRINGKPSDSIMFIPYPAQAQLGQSFVGLLNNYIERKTALSAPMQGVELPTKRTLGEIQMMRGEGEIRLQDTISSFRRSFAYLLKSIYRLYQQNVPEKLLMSIAGLTRQQFSSNISGDEDFIILGTLTTGNQLAEREENMTLYNLLSQNPLLQLDTELSIDLLVDILRTFDKKGLIEKLEVLKDKIQQQQQEQQILQEQQAMQEQLMQQPQQEQQMLSQEQLLQEQAMQPV